MQLDRRRIAPRGYGSLPVPVRKGKAHSAVPCVHAGGRPQAAGVEEARTSQAERHTRTGSIMEIRTIDPEGTTLRIGELVERASEVTPVVRKLLQQESH